MSSPSHDIDITRQFAYDEAFEYFNRALFDGTLPACPIQLSRKIPFGAFYASGRWGTRRQDDASSSLILINPDILSEPPIFLMSILVHEQCHLWQHVFGRPYRESYHDAEWSAQMERVGLMPSLTGRPGGRRTGRRLSHYVIEGGPFEMAFQRMPSDSLLAWRPRSVPFVATFKPRPAAP